MPLTFKIKVLAMMHQDAPQKTQIPPKTKPNKQKVLLKQISFCSAVGGTNVNIW
jgi:hypothetical protein